MRKPRRRNLHSGRLAKVNHFYSPDEVQALYGVCRNTVGNWLRSGLCCFENGSRRLFRGDQLNDFHRARRDRSKSPCGLYEIHCVSCGGKHSLLEGGLPSIQAAPGWYVCHWLARRDVVAQAGG